MGDPVRLCSTHRPDGVQIESMRTLASILVTALLLAAASGAVAQDKGTLSLDDLLSDEPPDHLSAKQQVPRNFAQAGALGRAIGLVCGHFNQHGGGTEKMKVEIF
jgi:hypothetical protein